MVKWKHLKKQWWKTLSGSPKEIGVFKLGVEKFNFLKHRKHFSSGFFAFFELWKFRFQKYKIFCPGSLFLKHKKFFRGFCFLKYKFSRGGFISQVSAEKCRVPFPEIQEMLSFHTMYEFFPEREIFYEKI